jgi:hypothetical protein
MTITEIIAAGLYAFHHRHLCPGARRAAREALNVARDARDGFRTLQRLGLAD